MSQCVVHLVRPWQRLLPPFVAGAGVLLVCNSLNRIVAHGPVAGSASHVMAATYQHCCQKYTSNCASCIYKDGCASPRPSVGWDCHVLSWVFICVQQMGMCICTMSRCIDTVWKLSCIMWGGVVVVCMRMLQASQDACDHERCHKVPCTAL